MRGKKPSEREKYMLRADSGTFVEVTREVYLEWHRAGRRERYQMEKKRAHGVCSLETLGENIRAAAIPGGYWENTPEENALGSACMEKLRESVACLPEQDARLLRMLFFEEMTVTAAALSYGCSRKSIQKRRDRILARLRVEMESRGIISGCF